MDDATGWLICYMGRRAKFRTNIYLQSLDSADVYENLGRTLRSREWKLDWEKRNF